MDQKTCQSRVPHILVTDIELDDDQDDTGDVGQDNENKQTDLPTLQVQSPAVSIRNLLNTSHGSSIFSFNINRLQKAMSQSNCKTRYNDICTSVIEVACKTGQTNFVTI